ncbi:MAG: glutamine synthetase, partial [Oscillospiraceae bacterium]|nr:glutamine synthetase [Oscillospiraceae bacterium]
KEHREFRTLPATLREAYEIAEKSEFIRENLPEEILRNFYWNIKKQLALYDAAEDKAIFEEQQYFLSE